MGAHHGEKHVQHGQYIHDFVVGFADGLTVPFALTAGLSSLGSSKLVVIGGLAELFSGAISMGMGAYLAAVTDRQRYAAELRREQKEVEEEPEVEKEEIYEVLCRYVDEREAVRPFVESLCRHKQHWVQFMMDFELKLEDPGRLSTFVSALVMGLAYFIGGLLPMIPYFAIKHATTALWVSIGITAFILLVFGYFKARLLSCSYSQSAISALTTLAIGALAAGASYGIVRAVDTSNIV